MARRVSLSRSTKWQRDDISGAPYNGFDKKLPPAAGHGFCLPVIGRVTLGLASGHFSAQTVRRDSLLVVGVTPTGNRPTGNRDAGKIAADATQLPTGCQPESLVDRMP